MCAIAGVLDLRSDPGILEQMLKTMQRRGPDETGVYCTAGCALLHTRLTVIDPVGGRQPMRLQMNGNSYILVYNGELYNTEELRRELQGSGHSFVSNSDTEVVLRAYAQWGEDFLHRLNGIFALGIWDETRKRLFVARDRIGVKPIFYKLHAGGFLFASEIKTILTYPTVDAELDATGAAEVLLLGPGRTPGSGVFRNIQELEPGCCGVYSGGKWLWRRYWKLEDKPHEDSFDETAERVRELVTDAIRRQLVSDFPVGTFLSGGLDSSLITAVCSNHYRECGAKLQTFSLDYQNNEQYFIPGKFQPESDNAYIEIMKIALGTQHHWTVLKPEELSAAFNESTLARDLPGMADVDSSLLLFCRQIREHVKVVLSGECADEIFGGYPWYRDPEIRNADGFPWAQNTKLRAGFLSPWITTRINPDDFVAERYLQTIQQSDILPDVVPQERRMKEMVNLNHRWFMQTLLDRKDRMSMYSGLEVRVPFCDHRIAEYLYSVPWKYKDFQGREKGLLRYAMAQWLPEAVLFRKKSPYPKTHDPHYLDLVEEMLRGVLQDPHAPILQLVRREALENLLADESPWPWYGQLMRKPQTIAYMLQLNFWLDAYRIRIV